MEAQNLRTAPTPLIRGKDRTPGDPARASVSEKGVEFGVPSPSFFYCGQEGQEDCGQGKLTAPATAAQSSSEMMSTRESAAVLKDR